LGRERPERETLVERAQTSDDLSAALAIRHQVFTEEQGIPAELDLDGLDGGAIHVLAREGDAAVATGRLVESGEGHGVLARIAVLPEQRRSGVGRRVLICLERIASERGLRSLSLHPHQYLQPFYEGLGYRRVEGESAVGEHSLITMVKEIEAPVRE